MLRLLLLFLITCPVVLAQNRFLVRVNDPDHQALIETILEVNGIAIVRDLDYPFVGLNGAAVEIPGPAEFNNLSFALNNLFPNNFNLLEDPLCEPTEGTGDSLADPLLPTPFPTNPALDGLVPLRPIDAPPAGHLTGTILVDIVGTGIDQSHPDLSTMDFAPGISVMSPEPGMPPYPAEIDYHNHETRLAGCIGGTTTGLLTALGTPGETTFRSVLCYDLPDTLDPAVPTTHASDCIAAIAEIIFAHEARLAEPYLKNHGAVLCFSHSVMTPDTRVGDLDSVFDLAWERGIITSISGGNSHSTAAANSPAGAGEFVVFTGGGPPAIERYWPPFGYPAMSYALPATVGFDGELTESEFHLKSGAHDGAPTPSLWIAGPMVGSNFNSANPVGLGPVDNRGIDLYAPGVDIRVPATRLIETPMGSPPDAIVGDDSFNFDQGFQKGNGTSYSAAFTTALATRILQLRPWADPGQVREALLAATTLAGDLKILTVPDLTTLDPMALSYDQWIVRYANIAPLEYFDNGQDDKIADPDGDGIPNFIEYHCGMDPRYHDPEHAPVVSYDGDSTTLIIEMQRACYLPSPAEVDWEFQSSRDLKSWENIGKGTVSSHGDGGGDGVSIKGTHVFATEEQPKEFYRAIIYLKP